MRPLPMLKLGCAISLVIATAASAQIVNVEPVATAITHSRFDALGMEYDGPISAIRKSSGSSTWRWYQTGGGYPAKINFHLEGSLSAPATTLISSRAIAGIPSGWGGWLMNVYKISGTSYLGFVHIESQGTMTNGREYSAIGLAITNDNGSNWTYLGKIIEPDAPQSSVPGNTFLNIRGVPFLIRNVSGTDYIYAYFNDYAEGSFAKSSAVARAPLATVITDAQAGRVNAASWKKYYGSAWNEPGVGGRSSPLAYDLGGSYDMVYDSSISQYVATYKRNAGPQQQVMLVRSSDGIAWTDPQIIATDKYAKHYFSFVSGNDNNEVSSGSPHIYYGYSPTASYADGATFSDFLNSAELRTHRLRFNGIKFQAEGQSWTANVSTTNYSSTDASAGAYRLVSSTSSSHYGQFSATVNAGNYRVKVGVFRTSTGGRADLLVDGARQGTVDFYAAESQFSEVSLGYKSFDTSGAKAFRFDVIGKDASSSDYKMRVDYVKLEPAS